MLPTTVYDNAKVRRRSQIQVMTQTLKSKGIRCNCGSFGIGGLLSLFMVVGLLYLTILHSSDRARPLRSLQGLSMNDSGGKESLATKENRVKLASYRKLERKAPRLPPRIKFLDGKSSENIHVNNTEASDRNHVVQQKTSINLLWENRQVKVVEAFRHAWHGYKTYAWGYDELKPISHGGEDGLGGLGATVVDALDTAIIMGLYDIVREAGSWIEENLQTRIETKGQVNLFETTIRLLGGLLSAYHLSGGGTNSTTGDLIHIPGPKPGVYLEKAKLLADKLMLAFTASPTAIPFSDVVLRSNSAHPAFGNGGASSTSEATTLQLELGYLSEVSGNAKYGAAGMHVLQHFKDLPKTDGLVPIYISPHTGHFHGENIRLGSRGDSYYEYLLKVWLRHGGAVSNGNISFLREMYDEAMEGVKRHLVRTSMPKGLKFVGELPSGFSGGLSPKMDHLVCFLAGNLALGATRGLTKQEAINKGLLNGHDVENLQLAEDLVNTCYEMYAVTATGLAPEIAYFHMDGEYPQGLGGGNVDAEFKEDIIIQLHDRHNLLRPETVESLFILYRITGDSKYRDWGWKIFQAFESHTKVESGGFSSLDDVTTTPAPKRDKMETFFLGETLKYLYLLFGDASVLPLDKYVFNTEAHPLPITSMGAAGVQ